MIYIIVEEKIVFFMRINGGVQKNMATYRNPELPLKSGLADDIIKFIKIGK
jgi:hypothetical protein